MKQLKTLLKNFKNNITELVYASVGVILLGLFAGFVLGAAWRLFMIGWEIMN